MFLNLPRLIHFVRLIHKTRPSFHLKDLLLRKDGEPKTILLSILHHRCSERLSPPFSRVVQEPAWLTHNLIGGADARTKIGGDLVVRWKNIRVDSKNSSQLSIQLSMGQFGMMQIRIGVYLFIQFAGRIIPRSWSCSSQSMALQSLTCVACSHESVVVIQRRWLVPKSFDLAFCMDCLPTIDSKPLSGRWVRMPYAHALRTLIFRFVSSSW